MVVPETLSIITRVSGGNLKNHLRLKKVNFETELMSNKLYAFLNLTIFDFQIYDTLFAIPDL